jgi:hypothetical protein
MLRFKKWICASIAAFCSLIGVASAQSQREYRVPRATEPPRIDGVLDDAAWRAAPMPTGAWASYNPNRGDAMPEHFRMDVHVTYDDRNVYFAFHCFDNEPEKIRTTVTRRDRAFSDDWVAISLDSAGTGQSAYHLFTNPSGSQMDAINTSASGEQFDADVVWYSAGGRTADGYLLEVQIPLQTLRFAEGDEVRMGLVLMRKVSRIGFSYAWPEMLPGQWVFDRPAQLIFSGLKPRRLVEVLPSVTYGINQERESATRWQGAEDKWNGGISGKVGITSGITLDGTINPDFSQVESDAFQVQVNQRFPVFFSEKRPFFMEGMGLFNIAGTGGDGNMRTAVHTRRIVDPIYGAKITGTSGKTTFGFLNALDDKPETLIAIGPDGEELPVPNRAFTIGRATYALRRSDYVGAIFTHTNLDGRQNLVAGSDISLRPSPSQSINATFLASRTSDRARDANGNAMHAGYSFDSRRLNVGTQVEHYDEDFQMDTAFYNRTGFTGTWLYTGLNFYPRSGQNFWIQRINPFIFAKAAKDRVQDGTERGINTGLRFSITRQGFINMFRYRGREPWRGRTFDVGEAGVYAEQQTLRWLRLYAEFNAGPAIFYDIDNPFQGRRRFVQFGVTLQPNQNLSQSIDVDNVRFQNEATGAQVYDVNILNSRTTYQFNKHFLVRLLAQYDSSVRRVLTDALASYELVAGTVFHAGYGSLYERRIGEGNAFVPIDQGRKYLNVSRGLFFKASYVHRF